MSALKMAGHEDRLSVVDHLEELRRRLIVSLLALAAAFGLCFWQSHALLKIINQPLSSQTSSKVRSGSGTLGQSVLAQQALLKVAEQTEHLASLLSSPQSNLSPGLREQLKSTVPQLQASVAKLPRTPVDEKPLTLGIAEPFTATISVTLYFAFLLALPVILFEIYGFILPALTSTERRVALPLLYSVPLLFLGGVLFGYFVVLPTAIQFLQTFNSSEFNVHVQANQYYDFAATTLIAIGLSFELPVAVLGAVGLGAVSTRTLRKGRRYAFLVCVLIAAILPGEAITMIFEAVPLYALYEASILIAALGERRRDRHAPAPEAAGA